MDLKAMTDAQLAELESAIRFERGVRFYLRPPVCLTVMSPGPPYYGAMCRLPGGHEGDHDFPTAEECRAAWGASVGASFDQREMERREAEHRHEQGWELPR